MREVLLVESEIRENLLNVKTEILGLGIRNTVQKIQNPTKDWNPESKFPWLRLEFQYLESGIDGMESRIQDCFGFAYMGLHIVFAP